MKQNILKYLRLHIILFSIAAITGLLVTFLFYFLRTKEVIDALNGATLSFVLLAGIGSLFLVANLGAFDSFAYGAKQMAAATFGKQANKVNDYAGYLEDKKTKRTTAPKLYLGFYAASIIYLIALIVLEIIYHL